MIFAFLCMTYFTQYDISIQFLSSELLLPFHLKEQTLVSTGGPTTLASAEDIPF